MSVESFENEPMVEVQISYQPNPDQATSRFGKRAAGVALAVAGLVGASLGNAEPAKAADGIHINTIMEGAEFSDIEFDSSGNPLIAAIDANSHELSLIECVDQYCDRKENPILVDTSVTGEPSIKNLGNDSFLIGYAGDYGTAIKLAECDASGANIVCDTKTIPIVGTDLQPRDLVNGVVDMDIGADGKPELAIVAGNENSRYLYHAKCVSTAPDICSATSIWNVDRLSGKGDQAIPEINANQTSAGSVITYYDASERNAIILKCEPLSDGRYCDRDYPGSTPLDVEGDVGTGMSADLRPGSIPIASYNYDIPAEQGGGGAVRVGTCVANEECQQNGATSFTIDDTVGEGTNTALAVRSNGNSILAYLDKSTPTVDLKLAVATQPDFSGENYIASNVDGSSNAVVGEVAIKISTLGKTAITFQEQTINGNVLKIAVCGQDTCGIDAASGGSTASSSSNTVVRSAYSTNNSEATFTPVIPSRLAIPAILGLRPATDPRYVLGSQSALNQ